MLFAAILLLQTAPAACTSLDAALPPALAGWTRRGHGDINDLTTPALLAAMSPEDYARMKARGPVPAGPEPDAATLVEAVRNRAPSPESGGMIGVPIRIEQAGRYGIAIDQPAWIELAPVGGASLKSVEHSHGPECSTIGKVVRFDVPPGLYQLTLTRLTKPRIKVMLVTGK